MFNIFTLLDESKKGQNEDEIRGKRVFVGNLSFKTTSRQLKEYMAKIGDVVKVDIFEDKNGNSKGFGYILHYKLIVTNIF